MSNCSGDDLLPSHPNLSLLLKCLIPGLLIRGASLEKDWTSIAAHERFALDPAYATIAEPIVALTTSPPVMHHGQFSPCDPSRGNLAPFVPDMSTGVSKGGVTELLYFYVWCKGERGGESEVMKRAETVRRGAEGAAGYMASVSGWVKEEVAVELLPREAESEEEKERFKVLVVAVAWEEVESWRVWRETKDGGEEVERVAMKVVRKCVRFCDARSKEGK